MTPLLRHDFAAPRALWGGLLHVLSDQRGAKYVLPPRPGAQVTTHRARDLGGAARSSTWPDDLAADGAAGARRPSTSCPASRIATLPGARRPARSPPPSATSQVEPPVARLQRRRGQPRSRHGLRGSPPRGQRPSRAREGGLTSSLINWVLLAPRSRDRPPRPGAAARRARRSAPAPWARARCHKPSGAPPTVTNVAAALTAASNLPAPSIHTHRRGRAAIGPPWPGPRFWTVDHRPDLPWPLTSAMAARRLGCLLALAALGAVQAGAVRRQRGAAVSPVNARAWDSRHCKHTVWLPAAGACGRLVRCSQSGSCRARPGAAPFMVPGCS